MKKKNLDQNKIPRNIIKTGGFKYIDNFLGGDLAATTIGAIAFPSLNIIPTGSDAKSRVGKKVRIFKVEYRLQLSRGFQSSSTVVACSSKVNIILDNATKGSSPVYADIFETGTINGFVNGTSTNRFTSLKLFKTEINTMFTYDTFDVAQVIPKTVVHEGSFSVNIPILFSSTGSTGAITQTVANCLLVTFIGDNTSTSMVQAGTCFRIYYIDEA